MSLGEMLLFQPVLAVVLKCSFQLSEAIVRYFLLMYHSQLTAYS